MSTYSTNLKLELIGNGEQSGTWGTTTNKNLGTLLEEAIVGISNITIPTGGNYVLSNLNGVTDEARKAVIIAAGSITSTPIVTNPAANTILVPASQTKTYIIVNNTTGKQAIYVQTYGSGTGSTAIGNSDLYATIPNGASITIYCTGSKVYAIAPFTATTATPIIFSGYVSGNTLTVTSAPLDYLGAASLLPGQTVYNQGILWTPSGLPANTTILSQLTGTTGGIGTYRISASTYPSTGATIVVGSVDYPQPIVALVTATQIATVDYTQSKTQSVYLQGAPTADTANAAAYEGAIGLSTSTTGVMLVSQYYVPGSPDGMGGYTNTLQLGQYVNGFAVSDGTYIKSWGTGTTGNATFTGYISGTTLTVTSGSVTGTITNSQYLAANAAPTLAANTKITGGSGVSWTVNNSQTIGSAASPVAFNAYGPLTNQTDAINAAVAATGLTAGGWVNVQNDSPFGMATAVRTPMISYLSPLQLTNVLWAANISSLIGTLGTQNDNAVNILGGAISGVTINNSDISVTSLRGPTVTVGSFVLGQVYTIISLGTTTNTQWNTIAGTSAVTYVVGSTFVCANIGTGLGNGTAAWYVGSNSSGTKTISSSAPSGGVDGDIWYQVT